VTYIGFFVAAMVVTLLQFLRLRDRKLLPLLALFAFQAAALSDFECPPNAYHLAAGAAGLVMLFVLSPRHPPGT
jgi:hypothetical protein